MLSGIVSYGVVSEEVESDVSATKNIFSIQSIFEYVCTLSTRFTVRSHSFEQLIGLNNWHMMSSSTNDLQLPI